MHVIHKQINDDVNHQSATSVHHPTAGNVQVKRSDVSSPLPQCGVTHWRGSMDVVKLMSIHSTA